MLLDVFKGEAIPIKGEHKEFIAIHKRKFGNVFDLCRVEYQLVFKYVDAIVIIPSSAGSLVELGMFVIWERLCRKTLILFNKDFDNPKEPSFIWDGPRIAYQTKGAFVEFVDYTQTDNAISIVKEFVSKIRVNKYDNNLSKVVNK